MIIVRSPLRISLGGGGTDLPSYFQKHEGFVLSAAINKYVFVAVNKPFSREYILKYSNYERTTDPRKVEHPIIREALTLMGFNSEGIEMSTMADLPSGTGLGSSGSFTTAVIKALSVFKCRPMHATELAELACHLELNILKEPIGKQDQYIAAFGGLTEFRFRTDGGVDVLPLQISTKTLNDLEDNLLLFFTGISRSASAILKDQDSKSRLDDKDTLRNLNYIKDLGIRSKAALMYGNVEEFGAILHEHWETKKMRSSGITNDFVNRAYDLAITSGAIGGKLVGAGGGGFLMFYASDKERLRSAMSEIGLEEVRFQFDFEGSKVVLS